MTTKLIYEKPNALLEVSSAFFVENNMAITVPETEPLDFYSGETVKWKRTDLSNYPAHPLGLLTTFFRKLAQRLTLPIK